MHGYRPERECRDGRLRHGTRRPARPQRGHEPIVRLELWRRDWRWKCSLLRGRRGRRVGRVPSLGDGLCGNQPVSGAPDNSSLSHFSAMTRPSWLGRAARNRQSNSHTGHGHDGVARMLRPWIVRPIDRTVRVLPGLREQRRRRRARQAGRLRLPESTLYRRVVWSHWVNFVPYSARADDAVPPAAPPPRRPAIIHALSAKPRATQIHTVFRKYVLSRGVGEAVSLLVVVPDSVATALARLLVDLLLRPRPRGLRRRPEPAQLVLEG